MYWLASFYVFSTVALGLVHPRETSLDAWIYYETRVAEAGVLANIGPNGSKDQGAASGVVIASPSTSPDYVFTWTRDSSLALKLLVDQFISGFYPSLQITIQNWVASQGRIQQVTNPSGTFHINETAITGAWGRPQRDGPALRATTMMTYGTFLGATNSYTTATIWPLVKLDLDYVAENWNKTGYDIWEEVSGSSFFTIAVQHRALRQGAAFATALGDSTRATTYTTQATNLLCFLQSFWNPTSLFASANVYAGSVVRSGLDFNTILASIHTFDPNAGCSSVTFQPCSDVALANHKAVVDSFRGTLYIINSAIASGAAVAVGRYKEDTYYSGNPWYVCTFAAAEQLYDALYVWNKLGQIQVTATSLAFFQQFSSSITAGNYSSTSTTYTTLSTAVKTYADGFLSTVQAYAGNGSLAEQYSKNNGVPIPPTDLTWSYVSALTAFEARNSTVPGAWGAANLTVPASCSTAVVTVAVTFQENATTVYGENIYITGSIDALEDWSPDNALLLSSADYPVWTITVNLPASTAIQYKYIRKYNGTVTWESDPNRSITTPASGTYTESDTWR